MKPNILFFSIFTLSLLCIAFPIFGQEKFEREFGIQAAEVPGAALTFIEGCFFDNKIKWYREESQDGNSFEAKTKSSGSWYSIEFDTLGAVIDVEKKVKTKHLSLEEQAKLTTALSREFARFKISKIQLQWKASQEVLWELINDGDSQKNFYFAYELMVRAKKDKFWETYEVLINPAGEILKTLEVVRRATDNIEQ